MTPVPLTPPPPQASAQLTERYCTTAQKLCFNYPQGYRVSSTPRNGGIAGEDGQVLDPEGKPVLFFADGMTGLGGACTDEVKVANTVVAVQPTQTRGLEARDGLLSSEGYSVQVVVPSRDGGYTANEYLSNSVRYAKPGQVPDCGEFYSDIIQGAAGSVHIGIYPFPARDGRTTFASVDEARAQFATQRYQLVSRILATTSVG